MQKCPMFQIADLVGKKWTVVLLQEISLNGEKGFNTIFKRMGKISPKILSKRLKEMEDEGIIKRVQIKKYNTLRTKYMLTEKGKELNNIISMLKTWNMKYSGVDVDCTKTVCVECRLY